jgi:nicotinamidase-related amidase
MSNQVIHDPEKDDLLSPENAALLIIDFQPVQIRSVMTMDHKGLVENIVRVARIGRVYGLPIVVSTVNVKNGVNKPLIPQLQEVLSGIEPIDRSTFNAWEDKEFLEAVRATGRKKLIITAIWTEVCLTFTALDALHEGYEVYAVVDAVGGTSEEAHRAGLERIFKAGAIPSSWFQLICELQRDWARLETVIAFTEILFNPKAPFVEAELAVTV